ncbi:MAG: hypothetical protein ACKVPX_17870 [Myxococcaceae bacterium]
MLGATVVNTRMKAQKPVPPGPGPLPAPSVGAELKPGSALPMWPAGLTPAQKAAATTILQTALNVAVSDPQLGPTSRQARMAIEFVPSAASRARELAPQRVQGVSLDAFTAILGTSKREDPIWNLIVVEQEILTDLYRLIAVLHHELTHIERFNAGALKGLSQREEEILVYRRSIQGLEGIRNDLSKRTGTPAAERLAARLTEQIRLERSRLASWQK